MIAVAVVALAAVVRWSLKGGGFGGYSEADRAALKRDELDMRLSQQDDEEHRSGRAGTARRPGVVVPPHRSE
jgi:hypothetical protein